MVWKKILHFLSFLFPWGHEDFYCALCCHGNRDEMNPLPGIPFTVSPLLGEDLPAGGPLREETEDKGRRDASFAFMWTKRGCNATSRCSTRKEDSGTTRNVLQDSDGALRTADSPLTALGIQHFKKDPLDLYRWNFNEILVFNGFYCFRYVKCLWWYCNLPLGQDYLKRDLQVQLGLSRLKN